MVVNIGPVTPFSIDVADSELHDLRERLMRTRWPDDPYNDNWDYGCNAAFLRILVDHWVHKYDWREREKRMNRLSHYQTIIAQQPIHFIHEQGRGPNPIPLILNHGWPWTFWDFQKIIGPLTDPVAHGGDPSDSFTVIAPSLPGFAFSTPLQAQGINFWRTADLWAELMTRLGYERFASQGADWGALVSAQLGHKFAHRIIGLHIQMHLPLDVGHSGTVPASDYAADEQDLLARNRSFLAQETGYQALLSTKPQTVAYGLNDSPVGLLAWLVEKRRSWSDCAGNPLSRFSCNELIDVAMLYWITHSFGSASRFYYEAAHCPWQPSHDRMPCVEAPVALAIFPEEVINQPRSWLNRYYNVQQLSHMTRGGHFGPMEEPAALIADIRNFFRSSRSV